MLPRNCGLGNAMKYQRNRVTLSRVAVKIQQWKTTVKLEIDVLMEIFRIGSAKSLEDLIL
jgi:hypothetical protein